MNIADEIKAQVTVRELCDVLGIQLKNGFAYCPFHPDKGARSLRVYAGPPSNFYCYGCHASGSVIDFAMQYYGIGFGQAVARLDDLFGLGLPLTRRPSMREMQAAKKERQQREVQAKADREALDAAETAFRPLFRRYLALQQLTVEERPRGPESQISARYADALWELPIVKYECQRAEDEIQQLREKVNRHGAGT